MTSRETTRSRLQVLFNEQYECTGKLNALLGDEARALIARDVDAIERLVAEKRPLVRDLEALDRRMRELLTESGFGTGRPDIDACIGWCDEMDLLSETWNRLRKRVDETQRQNRVNGATLESARRHVERAVALLRGESLQAATYTHNGAAGGTSNGRVLAKA